MFKRVMWGFDPGAVTTAIKDMQRDFEAAEKEREFQLMSLKEQNAELKDRLADYVGKENDLRDAFLSAQRMASQIKSEAEQTVVDKQNQIQRLDEEIDRLAAERDRVKEFVTLAYERIKDVAQLFEES